jgi:transcriptional regulator with XRE-family HTH domain
VIKEYRKHPYHGRRPLPQELLGQWLGITQAQVSRIENNPPIVHLDRLVELARIFAIPESHLWFTLPARPARDLRLTPEPRNEESTNRRVFLTSATIAALTSVLADAAGESRELSQWQEASEIGEVTLQHLDLEVERFGLV